MAMRLKMLLAAGLLAVTAAPAFAGKDAAERTRVERLAGLGKVWGQVRYAHPALATRDIDWDRALFDAIPRVNAARDATQYRDALAAMLAVLDDPATRVLAAAATAPPAPVGEAIVRGPDGVVRADLARLGKLAEAGGSIAARQAQAAVLLQAVQGAKALVLDARSRTDPAEDWTTADVLTQFLRQAMPQSLRLGAYRYRSYSGYPSQSGDPGSGGYYAGLMTESPLDLPGEGAKALPPTVFVTDANSAIPGEVLAGLQAARWAQVVAVDGATPDARPVRMQLGEGVAVQVRTAEVLAPDGVVGVVADFRPAPAPAQGEAAIAKALAAATLAHARGQPADTLVLPRPDRDRDYAGTALPPLEQRLLALFRFWNVFERFAPYRPLVGPDWDDLLQRYIPQFEANRDLADYQLTLRRLVAETHDSHAGVQTPMLESAERLGRHQPPVLLRFIEDSTVVAALVEEGTGLKVGDVVERIDGQPIEAARAYTGQFVPASTPQAWQRNLHRNLLRGQAHGKVQLDVRGLDGARRRVVLERSVGPEDTRLQEAAFKPRPQPVFGVLPSGLGYVDLARLTPGEVDAMFVAIAATPGTIFDMRGYPNGTAWSVAPRLGTRNEPVAARFRRGLYNGEVPGKDRTSIEFEQRVPTAVGARYPGKVVMLIDENAQSQAEHTGLFFEAATDVTFVGTPSAGANGDVTYMVLPGGYAVSFSGHDVRHADGRQLQRVGLQPTVRAAPTIAGFARGEDEVLAAGERWLLGHEP
jgi:C-terminal processing protease CtpA/Prc